MVRMPGAWRALAAAGSRLDPGSRLRRAFLRRQIISAYAAASRRDFELMLVRYAPDVEVEYDPDFEALGLGGTFHGHDGLLTFIRTWEEAWEEWELVPAMVLDMGDRFVALGHVRLRGTASGMELDREFAQLLTVTSGLVAHEREFLSWEKGLRAAGLEPQSVSLPAG